MSNNRSKTIIAILILLLLIAGAGLGYMLNQQNQLKKEHSELLEKKATIDKLNSELQFEYDKSLDQLGVLEGQNVVLDSMLTAKKEELKKNRAYIASILSKQNATEQELSSARALIAQFNTERETFRRTIDSLKQENEQLFADNIAILQEKEIIENSLNIVSREAEVLEQEHSELQKEVDLASILSASNVIGAGVKYKGGSNEVTVKRASAAKKLKICFDLLENKIAAEKATDIYLRIVGPNGVTMSLRNMGSGSFVSKEDNSEVNYTYMINPVFESDGKKVCSYWDQNMAYASGKYAIEVFQEGYLIGKGDFELK